MSKWVLIVFVFLVIVIVGILIWGFTTNWWKSFDDEAVSRYCYTACVNLDKEQYCTPNLIVHFKASNSPNYGSTWENVNCKDLAINGAFSPCQDISCP